MKEGPIQFVLVFIEPVWLRGSQPAPVKFDRRRRRFWQRRSGDQRKQRCKIPTAHHTMLSRNTMTEAPLTVVPVANYNQFHATRHGNSTDQQFDPAAPSSCILHIPE